MIVLHRVYTLRKPLTGSDRLVLRGASIFKSPAEECFGEARDHRCPRARVRIPAACVSGHHTDRPYHLKKFTAYHYWQLSNNFISKTNTRKNITGQVVKDR